MRTNIASLCSISSLSSDDMWTLKNISVGDAKLAVSCMFNQLTAKMTYCYGWTTHPGWSSFCGGIFFCSHLHTVHLVKVKDQKKRTLDEKKSRLKTSQAYVLVKCAPHKSLSIMKNAFMSQLCLQVHWWYKNRTNAWYISESPLCDFWFFFFPPLRYLLKPHVIKSNLQSFRRFFKDFS